MADSWIVIKETCPECDSRVMAKALVPVHVTVGTQVRCMACGLEGVYAPFQDNRGMYILWKEHNE